MKRIFEFIKYNDGDYNFVYQAKKHGYKDYVETFYGKWDDNQQHEMFNSYIETRKNYIEIVVLNGEKIGFIDANQIDGGEFEIGNICLMPEFCGKGFGTYYFEKLAREYPNKVWKLRVFKNNPAQNLYKRVGFEITEETDTHFYMVRQPK